MKNRFKISIRGVCITLFVIAFTITAPRLTNDYTQGVCNSMLFYFIACLGLSVMLGMGGQVSFATTAFMGIGAFTSAALSTKLLLPAVLTMPAGIIVSGCSAYVLGHIIFRLKGAYVAFSTIALTQIMFSVFQNWTPVTGGPNGTRDIPDPNFGFFMPEKAQDYFYVMVVCAVVCALIVERFRRTYYGRALASVRDNEIAASSLGVNVYKAKVISFTIAGIFAGFAGVLMAHSNHYISSSPFTFEIATSYVVMVMLGGVGSTFGVFVGAFIVTLLPEILRPLLEYIMLTYGLIVILLMMFMPMGLAGLFNSVCKKIMRGTKGKKVVSDDGAAA